MRTKVDNHPLHIYERSKTSKKVYRCLHPDCHHYNFAALLLGKRAECAKCKEPFILDAKQLKNKLPVCEFCSRSAKSKVLNVGRSFLETIFQEEEK